MPPSRVVVLAVVLATLATSAAVAHRAPPEGECVDLVLRDGRVTAQVTGPADVEAWVGAGGEWTRSPASFDGVVVSDGYRWVPERATVTATLPEGAAEFRLAVWSATGRDDTCFVARPSAPAPPPAPPASREAPGVTAPLRVAPARRATPPPARVAVRKSGPRRVRAGARAIYRIRVRNTSTRRVGFVLIDRLPRDVVLTRRPRGWRINGRNIRIPMVLAARRARVIRVPVRVLASARGRRCNVARVRGPEIASRRTRTCARVTASVGAVLPAVTG